MVYVAATSAAEAKLGAERGSVLHATRNRAKTEADSYNRYPDAFAHHTVFEVEVKITVTSVEAMPQWW